MSDLRTMSKAVAAGNRATTADQMAMQVPFFYPGRLVDGQTMGWLRIARREMWLAGIRVDTKLPGGTSLTRVGFQLCRGDLQAISGGKLTLSGVVPSGELRFNPDFPMPAESLWTVKLLNESGDEAATLPSDLTLTYWLRYAPGPSGSLNWTPYSLQSGIGFYQVGDTFVVG